MSFVHDHKPLATPKPGESALVVQATRLLARLEPDGAVVFPEVAALADCAGSSHAPVHVGSLDGNSCWLVSVEGAAIAAPDGWAWHEARAILAALTPSHCQAVSCARELHWWLNRHRFCGCCGAPTVDARDERAKHCPACDTKFFPSAAPAVIVAVTRGDRLLLAHNKNFRPGLFSLLAGFLDPGETLEQAAVREVREESGIEIGELRYVTSQPWPFPNSLMAGFRATHRAGEIAVDGHEIEQAGWFTRDALPEIPSRGTVAREIIDRWLREPGL